MKTILPILLLLFCLSCQQQDLPAPLPSCTEEVLLQNKPVICCIGFRVQKMSDSTFLRIVEFPSDVDTTGMTGSKIRIEYEVMSDLNCPGANSGSLCGTGQFYDPIRVLSVCVD